MPAASQRFQTLKEGASTEQIMFALHEGMTAYANLASAYANDIAVMRDTVNAIRAEQILERDDRRRIEQSVEEVRNELVVLRADVGRVDDRVRALEGGPPGPQAPGMIPPLPPMREKFASSSDIAKHAGHKIAELYEADLRNPSTPPPDAEKVGEMSAKVMEAAINKVKAEQWDQLQTAQKAAADASAKTKWALILGGGTAAISAAVAILEHILRVSGH